MVQTWRRIRRLHFSLRTLLALAALCALLLGWLRWEMEHYRRQIEAATALRGWYETETVGPDCLRAIFGPDSTRSTSVALRSPTPGWRA